MKPKRKWFYIYVDCHSTERFDVIAKSKKEARALYEAGEAHQCKDEVESRDVIEIEAGQEVTQ